MNRPAGMAISGLSGIGCSVAPAPVVITMSSTIGKLEVHTLLRLLVEQIDPLGRDANADELIEIAAEIAVGPHRQQMIADPDADQRAVAGELGGIDRSGEVALPRTVHQHRYVLRPDPHHRAPDSDVPKTSDRQTSGAGEGSVLHLAR